MEMRQNKGMQTPYAQWELDYCASMMRKVLDECRSITQLDMTVRDVTIKKGVQTRPNMHVVSIQKDEFRPHLFLKMEDALVRSLITVNSGLDVQHDELDAFDFEINNSLIVRCYQKAMEFFAMPIKNADISARLIEQALLENPQELGLEEAVELTLLLQSKSAMFTLDVVLERSLLDAFFETTKKEGALELTQKPIMPMKNLEVLENIPLDVHVELGSITKRVKEIVEFTPGMILELETTVNSPVAIIANNQLIAYGDVVVVNENYGVEIQKIMEEVDIRK